MPRIVVCSLNHVSASVGDHDASHLVTLIKAGTPVERPPSIPAERHLYLAFDDITEPMPGMVAPSRQHVRDLLSFVDGWDREKPIVVHCFAGISRSTAAAFISMCALNPERNELEVAQYLRAASPSATPNIRLVAIADGLLDRQGRMIAAIESIGRGEMAFEGRPFVLPLSGQG